MKNEKSKVCRMSPVTCHLSHVSRPDWNRGGQVLIEVLVAVSVLTAGFLGVMTLLSRALSLNRVVADNYVGTYLAAEGVEIAKNILDANLLQGRPWNDGFADGTYEIDYASDRLETNRNRTLAFDPAEGLYSYVGSNPTSFRRVVGVSLLGQNQVQVNSEVTWITRGGGTFTANVEDRFFNWRP